MGLPFNGIDLGPVRNAIGDTFDFDAFGTLMDDVHGAGTIHEVASERDASRIVADKCIAYSRRHGMLANLFLGAAGRTDVAEVLRIRLAGALREAFSKFEDVTAQVVGMAATWPQPPLTAAGVGAAARELKALVLEAADAVERPDMLKALRESAVRLSHLTSAAEALLQHESAFSPVFEATARGQLDDLEEAMTVADGSLARLSRPRPDTIEARWAAGLRTAITVHGGAVAAQDFDGVHSANNFVKSLLEAMIAGFEDDLLNCAASLPFERVAVALRDVASVAGLVNAINAIAPAILHCRIALSHRRETHDRWTRALNRLRTLRGKVPADAGDGDEVWLVELSDLWPSVRTAVRTLCLLSPDDTLRKTEQGLADTVGDAIAAAMQRRPDAAAELSAALASYLRLVEDGTTTNGAGIQTELEKLADLRRTLQGIRQAMS